MNNCFSSNKSFRPDQQFSYFISSPFENLTVDPADPVKKKIKRLSNLFDFLPAPAPAQEQ